MPKRFLAAITLAGLLLAAGGTSRVRPAAAADGCFPQTGKCVGPLFLQYWQGHGGLAQQGLPLTDEIDEVNPADGRTYRVQYFERARFERHPEYAGTPSEVLLGLLGREQYLARSTPGAASGGGGGFCFPQTGRCIDGRFARYWETHGGLAQQGLPLTDLFEEVNPADGRAYRVQYFERARFEYHPENAGTPSEVLLGLLGREQYLARYATGAPPTAGGSPTGTLDAEERALLDLINAHRAGQGLAPLALAPILTVAARWLSADLAAKGYFSHTDSLGRDPFVRMCAFGYCENTYKGENIAAGNAWAAATFRQWRDSPPHNANLLNDRYTVIGIGRAAGGPYGWYWTADFGGR